VRTEIEYGDGRLAITVPDDSVIVSADTVDHEPPPLPDPVAATRAALDSPLGCEPLAGQVGGGSVVTIAFPDRVKGGAHATAHRRVVLPLLLEQLAAAGVRREDIHLVCAIGLHRKNRVEEMAEYLGHDIVQSTPPGRLRNHDAEGDQLVDLGDSALGDPVQVNSAVVESDLTILVGHSSGNPYGGFSGGYKMPSTGLTTWRSIAAHHTPRTLYRADFVPASTGSRFRDQLTAVGKTMEAAMPRPFFSIDAVLDSRSRQVGVYAGAIPDVEQACWPLATARTDLHIDGPRADVLVLGMPRNFHYGAGMGSNPILVMQAIGASVVRAKRALVARPTVIAASVCDGWFNESEFPPYRAAYERLQSCQHPADMKTYEEELATDPEWVYRYRHHYGYHPFHAFSMIYMGGIAREHSAAIYVAGARDPGLARGMGARTTATVEKALAEAEATLGRRPRVLVVPELSKPAFHLTAQGS